MENRKWLKRKYPKSFNDVNEFLNDKQLEEFKKGKYSLARLIKPAWSASNLYEKGTLIMLKRSNPIRDYNYPLHYALAKCSEDLTLSGYQSLGVWDEVIEIIRD
jgi:hypothetical protein